MGVMNPRLLIIGACVGMIIAAIIYEQFASSIANPKIGLMIALVVGFVVGLLGMIGYIRIKDKRNLKK